MTDVKEVTDLSNVPPSVIRTLTPIIVNGLMMIGLDGIIANDALWAIASALVAIVYYVVVRVLEIKVSPNFGALIGARVKPEYAAAKPESRAFPAPAPPIPPATGAPIIIRTSKDDAAKITPVPLAPEPIPVVTSDEDSFPEEFLWMLQEKNDPDENAKIAASDNQWLESQEAKDLFKRE